MKISRKWKTRQKLSLNIFPNTRPSDLLAWPFKSWTLNSEPLTSYSFPVVLWKTWKTSVFSRYFRLSPWIFMIFTRNYILEFLSRSYTFCFVSPYLWPITIVAFGSIKETIDSEKNEQKSDFGAVFCCLSKFSKLKKSNVIIKNKILRILLRCISGKIFYMLKSFNSSKAIIFLFQISRLDAIFQLELKMSLTEG